MFTGRISMRLADSYVLASAQRCRDGLLQNRVHKEESEKKAHVAATDMIVDTRYYVRLQTYLMHFKVIFDIFNNFRKLKKPQKKGYSQILF